MLQFYVDGAGATYEWRLRSTDGKVFFEDKTTTAVG